MGFDRYGISSHAEHVGKKLLGQAKRVASDHVLGLQEPTAQPTADLMEGVAGSILLRLQQSRCTIPGTARAWAPPPAPGRWSARSSRPNSRYAGAVIGA